MAGGRKRKVSAQKPPVPAKKRAVASKNAVPDKEETPVTPAKPEKRAEVGKGRVSPRLKNVPAGPGLEETAKPRRAVRAKTRNTTPKKKVTSFLLFIFPFK